MNFQVHFSINKTIYLRDPETSKIGKQIIKQAVDTIVEIGFDQFTFKKLALEIGTTEATIYRYFENKHRLLLYILNWYWCYMEFLVTFKLENITDKKERLKIIVRLLSHELSEHDKPFEYNTKNLNQIVITESSKAYLVKEVVEINKAEVFKPYKNLCAKIAAVILEYNSKYKFPHSLSTTLIETSHQQQFFSANLPKLTDASLKNQTEFTRVFIQDFLFKILD